MNENRIVYSIKVADLQEVAREELDRELSEEEIRIVEDRLGDYINWFEAVAFTIADKLEASAEET